MKKNILFLLIDCLRADVAFGDKGSAKIDTISYLRSRGTSFLNTIATSSNTSPAVASLLTGLNPYAHGIRSLVGYKLNPGCVTLAEVLRGLGYKTCAMVTGPLREEIGLHRGFDEYRWRPGNSYFYGEFGVELKNFIKDKFTRGPWFLFAHFYEVHYPRQVLPPFHTSQYGKSSYEQALSCLDWHIGKILEMIDLDNTLIVLLGDHGEEYRPLLIEKIKQRYRRHYLKFGDKVGIDGMSGRLWWMGHGYHCYDHLIRVPLIFIGKGMFPENKTMTTMVSQIDVLPTLLDAIGYDSNIPPNIEGKTLYPHIRGKEFSERECYTQACSDDTPESKWIIGLRTKRWKYLMPYNNGVRGPFLYDLEKDPAETTNIFGSNPEIAKELEHKLREMVRRGAGLYPDGSANMSEEEDVRMKKLLEDLGYL